MHVNVTTGVTGSHRPTNASLNIHRLWHLLAAFGWSYSNVRTERIRDIFEAACKNNNKQDQHESLCRCVSGLWLYWTFLVE